MDSVTIGFLGFGFLLGLIFLGVPIAYAGAFVGTIGLWIIGGSGITLHYLSSIPYSEVAQYAYIVIPLYLLMGEVAHWGGVAEGGFKTAHQWFGDKPGGLAIATIVGGASFGAVCGASVASSAVLAKICIPEMRKQGYEKSMAAGSVAASANLSSMIPPSGLMIIYSIFTEQSLGKLFLAGVLPGLLIVTLFSIIIVIRVSRGHHNIITHKGPTWIERIVSSRHCWGIALIAIVVLGGIYSGIFSITEAGGAGVFITFILSMFSKNISWKTLKNILLNSMQTTVMVLFIIVGIMMFTHFLTLSRLPSAVSEFIIALPFSPTILIGFILALYFFLGMFFDAISMMALTLPLLFPTIVSLGIDPIWFGILCILMCEVGLITPPIGINCYVVHSVASDIPLGEVFRGVIPFVLANLVAVAIMMCFPQIVTFLPALINVN